MRAGIASVAALLLLSGSYAVAQEITATILGTVTDPSGAVVSGATIIVVNTDQAIVVRRLTTSSSGECPCISDRYNYGAARRRHVHAGDEWHYYWGPEFTVRQKVCSRDFA